MVFAVAVTSGTRVLSDAAPQAGGAAIASGAQRGIAPARVLPR
jgi:hypothetical protein